MMTWWHSLSVEMLTRVNGALVAITAMAGFVTGIGGVLIWVTTSRIEQLKSQADLMAAAERMSADAKLRQQIRQAENQATDAEARAGRATQRAEEAHALANRHVPRALLPEVEVSVIASLRTLLSKRRQVTLDLFVAGTEVPEILRESM